MPKRAWEKLIPTRRASLILFGLLAATAVAGCDAPQSAAVQPGAPPAFRIGTINVNTSPLLGQSGAETAAWTQSALPDALARAFAANMAAGAATAGTLNVTVNSIVIGPIGPDGQATDWISGVATLTGAGAVPPRMKVRADTFYQPMAVDQALWRQAMQGRVTTLAQAFADTLARRWR